MAAGIPSQIRTVPNQGISPRRRRIDRIPRSSLVKRMVEAAKRGKEARSKT
jgi:hypothetical protein